MATLSLDKFLAASDLKEQDVELPTIGGSVKIKALSTWFSDEASSEAIEMTTDNRGQQKGRINTPKLNAIKIQRALIEPPLGSIDDAAQFLKNCGPAGQTLIDAINKLSGIDEDTVEKTEARFPAVRGDAKDSAAS